jgi:hypothetical protein
MKSCYGSGCGSADPYLRLIAPDPDAAADSDTVADPDPVTFVSDLQDVDQKQQIFVFKVFLLITFTYYVYIFQR